MLVGKPLELKNPQECNHAVRKVVKVGDSYEIYCLHCNQRMDGE